MSILKSELNLEKLVATAGFSQESHVYQRLISGIGNTKKTILNFKLMCIIVFYIQYYQKHFKVTNLQLLFTRMAKKRILMREF